MRSIALIIASLATAFAQAAAAQEIPGRVGRLAYTQGPVSVYQDPEFGWDKAYVNTPITSENSVWTDRGARAEMRVGGTAVRLDGETQLDVSRLDDDVLDATIQRGTVNVRVRYKERRDQVTFATPNALFNIETDGRYRIDVDEENDESRLTVFGGYAFLEGPSGRVPVEPGRTMIVSAGRYEFTRAGETSFDRWAAVRDRQWQDSNSRRYVSYDMTGYEELDRYGTWSQDADYGAIWYPTRISAGWAPYRDGHWTYIRPWGWTWVDDAPWGYAPSHYGRWVQVGTRWGWMPGAVRERPVWAPAVVGFIGGSGFSVGISTGAPVGWYPLAPWERYDPWYRASPTYVTRVNRYVVDRAPRWWQGRGDEWRYWNRERAVTVVNRDVFVNRRAVQGSTLRINPEALRQAPVASSSQVVQQVLPQRNEVLRFREQNRVDVAAPVVTQQRRVWNERRQEAAPQPQVQPQQQAGQVVRPEFRRRGEAPVAVTPAPAQGQPPVAAPAPQLQPQPQNPTARVERAQQRQAEDAARAAAQQQQQQQREAEREAERAQRDRLQSDQNRMERAQQRQAEEAARAAAAQQTARDQQRAVEAQRQQQQQEQAQRQQQEQAQRQQLEQAQRQQQEQAQRQQQEQAQRAAREAQQQQERAARENQQQQQRQAREAQQAQERAQREAQQQQQQAAELQRRREEAAQRAARDTQAREQAFRQQQEAAQRAQQEAAQRAQQQQLQQQQQAQERARQQQQQAQERAQRAQPQPAPPPPAQAQPQPQPAPQANPTARGEGRGRGRDKDKEDKDEKDKEKDKDKR